VSKLKEENKMNALQKQHIVDLFVWVDDTLPERVPSPVGGRPPVLTMSDIVTILIWDGLNEPHKTLKDVYAWIKRDYGDCFPKLPEYQNFVVHAHQALPVMIWLLQSLLHYDAKLRFGDSTMLPVCKNIRANDHKVAKAVAAWGKNWQGWHYGFKLHASIDHDNNFTGICFTPAAVYDAQKMEELVKGMTGGVFVGDSHYGASVMGKRLWKQYGVIVIAPPHYKQRKKMMTSWQHLLLTLRPKIEATFDYLKEHMHIVSSFPRSIQGYFVHYIRTLLGYQMRRVS
jgi:hypothetical protein